MLLNPFEKNPYDIRFFEYVLLVKYMITQPFKALLKKEFR